jgi:hypothetical protein
MLDHYSQPPEISRQPCPADHLIYHTYMLMSSMFNKSSYLVTHLSHHFVMHYIQLCLFEDHMINFQAYFRNYFQHLYMRNSGTTK